MRTQGRSSVQQVEHWRLSLWIYSPRMDAFSLSP
ncbi:hypothetical protein HU200_048858 [Digitaria exilis]|uniref:Uncharacterized protein n=1 Tax=Digitaria exilis TaxID=1010633 RepID=A0A835B0V6_9POAL|nr:hypothetical protein HU200_048858 [Digitaria exilis]